MSQQCHTLGSMIELTETVFFFCCHVRHLNRVTGFLHPRKAEASNASKTLLVIAEVVLQKAGVRQRCHSDRYRPGDPDIDAAWLLPSVCIICTLDRGIGGHLSRKHGRPETKRD